MRPGAADDPRVSDVEGHVQAITHPWNNALRAITKDYESPGRAQQNPPREMGEGREGILEVIARKAGGS